MSGLLRLASSSRSALIAGALFATPGLVACGDDSSDTTDVGTVADTAQDTASDTASDTGVVDGGSVALYGMPADVAMDMGPDPDAVEDAEQPPPDDAMRAAYGMPPQEDVAPPEPDAQADTQDASPEDVPRALYGMPPQMPDAEADASDASDAEDTGPTPQPVYGMPSDAGSSDASDASDS